MSKDIDIRAKANAYLTGVPEPGALHPGARRPKAKQRPATLIAIVLVLLAIAGGIVWDVVFRAKPAAKAAPATPDHPLGERERTPPLLAATR